MPVGDVNVNSNFDDLKKTWSDYGLAEPYWSVLTVPIYLSENLQDDALASYHESGEIDIRRFENILQTYQTDFRNKIVLDFGCGTGRILGPCSKLAEKVYGFDISQPHLDLAKQYVPTAELYCVDDSETLPALPTKVDIIYSHMVLQHIRPPLIKKYIRLLLELLNAGGIAMLHVPYYVPHYNDYRDEDFQGNTKMEIHKIDKEEMHSLIAESNCELLGEDPKDCCGGGILNTTYIIKKL